MGKFQVFAQSHPIVVRGTISKHGDALRINPEYFKDMTIAVTDVVKGDFPHTSFEFYGDTGMSCLRYITADDYPIGSEHLFILSDNSAVQPLMVCGESSVLIQGNTVVGRESFEKYTMKLDELIQLVR